ncbi:hypothetical protein C8R43DRAFT_951799 [Mycena crocata]|nr:hypothetical protein C8R43DRAFT_951799 [Mycena crocata]
MVPIPDILIYDRYALSKHPPRAADLLWNLPQTRHSTLLLVKHGSITMSRPQNVAPLRWKRTPLPRILSSLLTRMKRMVPVCIPTTAAFFVFGSMNLRVLFSWAYQRVSILDQRARIENDIRPLYPGHWMRIDATVRIQMVSESFSLVTIAGELSRQIRIKHISDLHRDVYAAMLSALDLPDHLVHLTIEKHSELAHTDVLGLIQRHPNLETVVFESDSIRIIDDSASSKGPVEYSGKIRILSAPMAYIPRFISAAPNVERIYMALTQPGKREDNALHEYQLALMSIAALPGVHPLVLTLTFDLDPSQLPWAHFPPGEETRLHRVEEIVLGARRPLNFNRAAILWLGSFPSLKRVVFMPRCLVPLSLDEQLALTAAICDGCRDQTMPVIFDVR